MVTHKDNVLARVRLLIEQYSSGMALCKFPADEACAIFESLQEQLADLYNNELPLAEIMDLSDLVVHAEGASIKKDVFKLKALNALTETTNDSLLNLVANSFRHTEPKLVKKQLSVDITGLAPGSIFIGTKIRIKDTPALFEDEDKSLIEDSLNALYQTISFIKEDEIDAQITEAISDPAIRDSTMIAALGLAPSGKQGISKVEIISPNKKSVHVLTPANRKILRNSIRKGLTTRSTQTRLEGEVREINLDTYRFVIKTNDQFVVRCLLSSLNKDLAQRLIGKQIVVRGNCEYDRNNNPRLLTIRDPSDILSW